MLVLLPLLGETPTGQERTPQKNIKKNMEPPVPPESQLFRVTTTFRAGLRRKQVSIAVKKQGAPPD
jgi:hypothetical protein